jgi:hypothetical protein
MSSSNPNEAYIYDEDDVFSVDLSEQATEVEAQKKTEDILTTRKQHDLFWYLSDYCDDVIY